MVDIGQPFNLIELASTPNNLPVGNSFQQVDLLVSDPDNGDTATFDPTGWFQSGNFLHSRAPSERCNSTATNPAC